MKRRMSIALAALSILLCAVVWLYKARIAHAGDVDLYRGCSLTREGLTIRSREKLAEPVRGYITDVQGVDTFPPVLHRREMNQSMLGFRVVRRLDYVVVFKTDPIVADCTGLVTTVDVPYWAIMLGGIAGPLIFVMRSGRRQ